MYDADADCGGAVGGGGGGAAESGRPQFAQMLAVSRLLVPQFGQFKTSPPHKSDSAATPAPVTMPPMSATMIHVRALRDAACAPATSPAASFEFTCAENTSATTPNGRQQQSVTAIDCQR